MPSETQAAVATAQARSQATTWLVAMAFIATWILCVLASNIACGQQGGGDTGGDGGGGDGGQVNQQPTTPTTNQTTNVGDGQFDPQQLLEGLQIPVEDVNIENERVQPFVGRSIQRFQEQELVHPRSQIAPGSAGGAGGGGGTFTFGGRGAGDTAATGTFEVSRRSLRTRIRADFWVPPRANVQVVSTRFQNRLSRLPSTQMTAGVSVRMEGRTAILSGSVNTPAERQRVERMARLEPGVYRIQNQIQVVGQ